MKIKAYLSQLNCDRQALIEAFAKKTNEHYLCLSEVVAVLCEHFHTENGMKTVAAACEKVFERRYASLSKEEREERVRLDKALLNRLAGWLDARFGDMAVISRNERFTHTFEDQTLEFSTSLILTDGENYYALLPFMGSNGKVSLKGRSIRSRIDAKPECVIAKARLETAYPGITVVPFFVSEGEKKGAIEPWNSSGTQKANAFELDYADCYEKGTLDTEVLLSRFYEYIGDIKGTPKKKRCEKCPHKNICDLQTVSKKRPADEDVRGAFHLPEFDEHQQKLVNFGHGRAVFHAPAGSGKTAALCGRILQFGKKVPTEQMVVVTFTEKAAGEVRDRLSALMDEADLPFIGTVHSLAMRIVRTAERIHEEKNPVKILGDGEKYSISAVQLRIIENAVNVLFGGVVTGVDMRIREGKYSASRRIASDLISYLYDKDEVLSRNPEYVPEEWESLAKHYNQVVREGNYVTFEQLIVRAREILLNDFQTNDYISRTYKYIMVDEYQDIEESKERLIALLSQDGELVVIGDSSQNIFQFTGCYSTYMEEFCERYPDAERFSFEKNYRSTDALIKLSDAVVGRVHESVGALPGEIPVVYDGQSSEQIGNVLKEMLQVYHPGDIAVIGRTWKSLESVAKDMTVPVEIARAKLTDDFLLRVIYHGLNVALDNRSEDRFYLGILFERGREYFETSEDEEIKELLSFITDNLDAEPKKFTSRIACYLDLEDSVSEEAIRNLIEVEGIANTDQLRSYLGDMILYGDEKKIEYPIRDAVTFITAHSAKGKEWKCVLLLDADSFDTETEEGRNLLYVSLSRARERLAIFKTKGSRSYFDDCELVTKGA